MIIPSTPKTGQVPQCKWKSTKMLELKLSMKYNELYNSVNIYKKPFYWLAIWTHQILALETTRMVIWVLKIWYPKISGPMGWNMAWPPHGHLGSNSSSHLPHLLQLFSLVCGLSLGLALAELRRFDQPNSRIHVQKSSKTIWRYSRGSRIDMNWWEVEDFSVSHLVWTILQKMQPPPSSHGKKNNAPVRV